ncbi:MAG TPA: hypothetical protein V6C86_09935 [Oculatellaceae cyanobacterium]
MKNILAALAITVIVSTGSSALAHDNDEHNGIQNTQHGDEHSARQNMQHSAAMPEHNSQNWQSSWTQQNNPNNGYYQQYQGYFQKHPTDHRVLEQSEAQYHELLRQGRITQQEHQMLDAQLRAQHAQQDSGVQNNFNRYGYPYANRNMPRLINKLQRFFNY